MPADVRRRLAATAVVLGALVLSACGAAGGDEGSGLEPPEDTDGLYGKVLDQAWPLPASVRLQDTSGEATDLRRAADKPLTMIFFGYTHCPDICIAVMSDVASALNRLDAEEAEQVDVWFVTTDPARDDGPTIRKWLDRFDPGFRGFTGPLDRIVALAGSQHVPVEKGPRLPSGGYDVTHGTPVLGVVPGGETKVVWTEGTSAAKLAADMRAVIDDPGLVDAA